MEGNASFRFGFWKQSVTKDEVKGMRMMPAMYSGGPGVPLGTHWSSASLQRSWEAVPGPRC